MKLVTIEEFRAHVDQYLAAVAEHEVVLTRDGKPIAVLHSLLDNGAVDSSAFAQSPAFWEMILQRQQEQGKPWEDARQQIGLPE